MNGKPLAFATTTKKRVPVAKILFGKIPTACCLLQKRLPDKTTIPHTRSMPTHARKVNAQV